MSTLPPPFDAQGQHWLNIRVYYEDTDFTGMVYHANYLRFFERGRCDYLRDAGVSHQALLSCEEPAAFTLTNVEDIMKTKYKHLFGRSPKFTNYLRTWEEAGVVIQPIGRKAKLCNGGSDGMFVRHVQDCVGTTTVCTY